MAAAEDLITLDERAQPHVDDRPGPFVDERLEAPSERPSPPDERAPSAPRRWVRPALFLLLPVALIGGGYWYVTGGRMVSMEDAYVEADKVGVSTDVSGVVKDVDVAENQPVVAGQVLYRLDDLPFRLALERAQAQVGAMRNDLNALKASYGDMQAQVKQGKNDVQYFGVEANRQQDLLTAHVASQSSFDSAHRNLQTAQQKVASLDQQLAAIAANLNGDPGGPVERNPRYLEAVAQRDEAARQLEHTVVRAPFAGIATNVPSIAPGKYLQASTTAFYLVSADHVWVDANPKETELTYVRTGQPATVKVDTYPDARWRGVVESISPAAAQEFSLLPAQNSSGNWVKVVQRIPIRVRVDTRVRRLPPLRAGMSVEIDVDTGHARGLPHALTGLFGQNQGAR
ncbi:MAG: hemolysin secretion protein [Caulobacteraceae bacterium]|jgi:membrane fusion protein (multidrug efflux system)|nr:hemolysin secretion protein [Caulobacteraceae bacterium]